MDALTASRSEARALLLLAELPGVGPATIGRLRDRFGSGRAAWAASGPLFAGIAGTEASDARGDARLAHRVDAALARADLSGMALRTVGAGDYPPRLLRLADPPPVLFLRGRASLLEAPGVAVVGARRATVRARDVARRLGRALGAAGIPVVSGMALGVDGAAHAGALDAGGPTVAVLGSGADRPYPRSHIGLFRRILRTGLVVSEFLPGTGARSHHFPQRNRVLAALSHTVVVVEAGRKSGSLITVGHALDLGLDVRAVPGPIDTRVAEGSNRLLADGAGILVSVEEFVAELVGRDETSPVAPTPPEPTGEVGRVLACLGEGDRGVDEVAREMGVPPSRAWALLTRLELQGVARRLPGSRFRRAG